MSRNGSGVYSLPAGNPVVTLTQISSTWANATLTDIATELTNSIDKGGRTAPTANLPMAGYKHTGAGIATAAGQYVTYNQAGARFPTLGIGTAISAWGGSSYPIDLGPTGFVFGVSGALVLGNNSYFDGTDYRAKVATAGCYATFSGTFDIYTVASVSAGAVQTPVNRFNIQEDGAGNFGGSLTVGGNLTSANPIVMVSDGGTQTRYSTSFTIMDGFTTEILDTASAWASSTFTAPVTGTYFLTYSTVCEGAAGAVVGGVRPHKNGSAISGWAAKTAYSGGTIQRAIISDSGYISLTAGDTLALYAQRASGSADCYLFDSTLSIRLV